MVGEVRPELGSDDRILSAWNRAREGEPGPTRLSCGELGTVEKLVPAKYGWISSCVCSLMDMLDPSKTPRPSAGAQVVVAVDVADVVAAAAACVACSVCDADDDADIDAAAAAAECWWW